VKGREQLQASDVNVSVQASSSGTRHRSARDSRKLDKRTIIIRLEHVPSEQSVEGTIPEGHYSRGELRTLKDQLTSRLFRELEAKVARHLRLREL
jgi:hypothetical protein